MATPNPLGSNLNITLENNKVITLTKRTIRFSKNVYQTHNITGFSEGEVDMGTIPWSIIVSVFFASLIAGIGNSALGGLLVLAAIGGAIWNFSKPKHYGLLLTLNSGDKKLFTTNRPDRTEKLKEIIAQIYELIESEKEVTYQISISNSEISGNIIQGNDNKYLRGDL